jgi:hypothetical protein
MSLLTDIETARTTLDNARRDLAAAVFLLTKAQRALESALRTGQGIPAAQAEVAAKQTDVDNRRTALQTAKNDLRTKVGQYTPPTLSATDEMARLLSDVPLVLLPVRIETRFDLSQSILKIRVYPDEVFASAHEEALTEEEFDAGTAYDAISEPELTDWQTLLSGRTPQRAAFIRDAVADGAQAGKADSWTQPTEVNLLPDRWIAIGYRPDGGTSTAVGALIEEPLRVSFDPGAEAAETVNGVPMDPELKWTVDFNTALGAGMALQLGVDAAGFDRLLVFGVKGSMTPPASAEALWKLMRAHRYAEGVAIVRQGTPTNNSEGRAAGYPPDDEGGRVSFDVEEVEPEKAGSDGERLRLALGAPPSTFSDVAGRDATEDQNAAAMNTALWSASLGYFLQHMLDPVQNLVHLFPQTAIESARAHFNSYVRGRGPFAAFRIGAVPYSVLPVSTLNGWKPTATETQGIYTDVPAKLAQLQALWLTKALEGAPRVGKNPTDADGDLLRIMGLNPSARQVRVRSIVGDAFQKTLFDLLRTPWGPWAAALQALAQKTFSLIGQGTWNVRVGRTTQSQFAFPFHQPLVGPEPLSEELDVAGNPVRTHIGDENFNYIDGLRLATVAQLKPNAITPTTPQSLLYHVLRHSLLTEYARLAREELQEEDAGRLFMELLLLPFGGGPPQDETIWVKFDKLKNGVRVEDLIKPKLAAVLSAFKKLAELSQAELERLLSETLDLASHRLDAWITSLYSKRLLDQRQNYTKSAHALVAPSYLGAFAWVEDLRPGPINRQSGGYIHAPSTAHAAAAAILRSGFVSRKPEAVGRFAYDLSSQRVRLARSVLDAVRGGQPAGAVLGYRFERTLHEAALDKFIDPLRSLYPLVANKSGLSNDPAQSVAARSVVDGLVLRQAWQGRTSDDAFFAALTPAPSVAEKAALVGPLNALDEAVDGVADLLTAESVYQMVRGNAPAAAAPLDALAGGAQPPDPEIGRTPRGGTAITHRVACAWSGADPARGPWAGTTQAPIDTRRSDAEPVLDDWVGSLLGLPENARCWVVTENGGQTAREPISFKELKVRPLDVIDLATQASESGDLERRILTVAQTNLGNLNGFKKIDFEPDPNDSSWNREVNKTFPEVLELARQIATLFGHARSARSMDFLPLDGVDVPLSPDEQAEHGLAQDVFQDIFEIEDIAQLDAAIATGTSAVLTPALVKFAQYVPGAYPDPRETQDDLRVRAKLIRAEVKIRQDTGNAVIDAAAGNGTPETALAIYRALFGRTFLRLSRFTVEPAAKQELDRTITALAVAPDKSSKLLRQNARLRAPLGAWRKLWLHAEAGRGSQAPSLDVAQLPHVPGEGWAGETVPAGARLSLVMGRTAAALPDLSQVSAGLVVDEWTEVIPNSEEQTGLTFNYDNPGAEAAQTILVAVRPDPTKPNWSLNDVTSILQDTLNLAKVRAIEPALLGDVGQALPALYLTDNADNDTVSTNFTGLLENEASRVPRQV